MEHGGGDLMAEAKHTTLIPVTGPNGEGTGPVPTVGEGMAAWTPERVAEACMSAGMKAAAKLETDGKGRSDPVARLAIGVVIFVGALLWFRHESGAGEFKAAMDANREATYIMIDVICEAHPEAKPKCSAVERRLNRQ
jgi:hypothetical protein